MPGSKITKDELEYKKKMVRAALDLTGTLGQLEEKYDLTILDTVQLLSEEIYRLAKTGGKMEREG